MFTVKVKKLNHLKFTYIYGKIHDQLWITDFID